MPLRFSMLFFAYCILLAFLILEIIKYKSSIKYKVMLIAKTIIKMGYLSNLADKTVMIFLN